VIKEQLAEIGIEVTIDSVGVGVSMDRMNKGDFEFTLGGSGLGRPTRLFLGNQYLPDAFWTDKAAYNSPEMVALFEEATLQTDREAHDEILKEIQRLGYEDLPFIPVLDRNVLIGSRLPQEIFTVRDGQDWFYVAPLSKVR
jgi:peptide/nickel transport system substrate-binding protein